MCARGRYWPSIEQSEFSRIFPLLVVLLASNTLYSLFILLQVVPAKNFNV